MATDLNIAPYFNDYDELKNYHHILFRPGFAVQARELTELQSILKNQIEKFGNHVFKQGSVVIPGNSNSDIGVPYVTLDTAYADLLTEGRTLVGSISGVKGIIKKVIPATDTEAITVYVTYTTGGVESDGITPNGNLSFIADETISITDSIQFNAKSIDVGIGSLAYVNQGVYYVNGTFVTVLSQRVVIDKYGITPHCHVLLKINEAIVTADEDDALLDPAYGSYNFAAPGADRYQIQLELVSLPYGSEITGNYIELMRYNNGVLEEHARYPKYNELEKSLARRTFDESGDYVVSGLRGTVREHYKSGSNGGLTVDGSRDNYCVTVSPGKAYINGFEVEKLPPVNLVQPKGRTIDHIKSKKLDFRIDYGRYILITDVIGELSFKSKQYIEFYDGTLTSLGTKIGSARILSIDYFDVQSVKPIYKVWISDVQTNISFDSVLKASAIITPTTTFGASIVREYYAPLTNGTFVADEYVSDGDIANPTTISVGGKVAHWEYATGQLYLTKVTYSSGNSNITVDLPLVGHEIIGSSGRSIARASNFYFGTSDNIAIIPLPVEQVASFESSYNTNLYDYEYVVQAEFSIHTDSSGNGTSNTTNGVIRSIDTGTVSIMSNTGISIPLSRLSISPDNKSFIVTGGPSNEDIKIYATVQKDASNAAIRSKTLLEVTETGKIFDSNGYLILENSDVYSIVSITTASSINIPLSYITLNVNQTDYSYEKSSISISGIAIPTETLTIVYKYFAHGSGDFFCFDSYKNVLNHSDLYVYYKSSSGKTFNLKNCIDFRSTVGVANSYVNSAMVCDPFTQGEIFSTTIQYYVPRYDLSVMDKSARIYMIQGVPSDIPEVPSIPVECIPLEKYYVPGYTERVSDIKNTRLSIDRFTMKDISKLATRIENLEDFSTLLAAELNAIQYEILDEETGLARFKTGYLVETFKTPLVIADIFDSQFHATFYDDALQASVEEMHCTISVIGSEDSSFDSSGFMNTGGVYTLPYVEVPLIRQPMSSRVTNLNPFLIIKWDGVLTVTPDNDYWIEQLDLPLITQNATEIVTVTRWIEFPEGPTVHEDIRTGTTVMPVTTPPFVRTVFV